MPIYIPFIVNIGGAIGEAFFELYWMRHYIGFPMWDFYKKVYLPVFILLAVVLTLSYSVHILLADYNEYLRMVIVGLFSVTLSLLLIYRFGLSKSMRDKVSEKILSRFGIKRKIK